MPLSGNKARSWCGLHDQGSTSRSLKISLREVTGQSIRKRGGGGGSITDRTQKGTAKCQSASHLNRQPENVSICTGAGHPFSPPTTLMSVISCNSFLCLLVCSSLFPSNPFLLTPSALAVYPLTQHGGSLPSSAPAAWPPMLGESTGHTWGSDTAQHFLSLHPTPRPRSTLPPSPESFLFPRPGPSRTLNCQRSECHIPRPSQPHGEGSDSCMGGRGGAGTEKFSRG